jgi:hypothetical protein
MVVRFPRALPWADLFDAFGVTPTQHLTFFLARQHERAASKRASEGKKTMTLRPTAKLLKTSTLLAGASG